MTSAAACSIRYSCPPLTKPPPRRRAADGKPSHARTLPFASTTSCTSARVVRSLPLAAAFRGQTRERREGTSASASAQSLPPPRPRPERERSRLLSTKSGPRRPGWAPDPPQSPPRDARRRRGSHRARRRSTTSPRARHLRARRAPGSRHTPSHAHTRRGRAQLHPVCGHRSAIAPRRRRNCRQKGAGVRPHPPPGWSRQVRSRPQRADARRHGAHAAKCSPKGRDMTHTPPPPRRTGRSRASPSAAARGAASAPAYLEGRDERRRRQRSRAGGAHDGLARLGVRVARVVLCHRGRRRGRGGERGALQRRVRVTNNAHLYLRRTNSACRLGVSAGLCPLVSERTPREFVGWP